MRFIIEVDYDADGGEDIGAVGRVFGQDLAGYDGVTHVRVHGEDAHVVTRPGAETLDFEGIGS